MNDERINDIHCRIIECCNILMKSVCTFSEEHKNVDWDVAMKMSDITKDCSEAIRHIHECHHLMK